MGNIFKVVTPDGRVAFTDTPQGNGSITSVTPGHAQGQSENDAQADHQRTKRLIKEAQKRIPKFVDYLNYLDYLRTNSPIKFDRVMRELQRQDPQTWIKLQKYPQFRPLKEMIVGVKAGNNLIGAGIGLAGGNITGSTEKWMENTLTDLMKRDRFGPYADVLGSKASTLPVKTEKFSQSRLGQYMKTETAAAAKASAQSAKELAGAQSALRAAKGTAVVRVMGPLVDLGIALLNPEIASGVATEILRRKTQKLYEKGVIDVEQWDQVNQLMNQGKYAEVQQFLNQATNRYITGGNK